jgi:hypothetical protein
MCGLPVRDAFDADHDDPHVDPFQGNRRTRPSWDEARAPTDALSPGPGQSSATRIPGIFASPAQDPISANVPVRCRR